MSKAKGEEMIEVKDYLQELKKQIKDSEKGKRKEMMKVRSLEVELETITGSSGKGGLSFYVVHSEMQKATQTRNRIKIILVSPDIIQMEAAKQSLEEIKVMLDHLKKP